jgi:hypothetical protein
MVGIGDWTGVHAVQLGEQSSKCKKGFQNDTWIQTRGMPAVIFFEHGHIYAGTRCA